MNAAQKIESLVEKLRRIPDVEITQRSYDPISGSTIQRMERLVDRPLDPFMAAFYASVNGFYLSWKHPLSPRPLSHFFNYLPIEEVFGGKCRSLTKRGHINAHHETVWWDEDDSLLRSINQRSRG